MHTRCCDHRPPLLLLRRQRGWGALHADATRAFPALSTLSHEGSRSHSTLDGPRQSAGNASASTQSTAPPRNGVTPQRCPTAAVLVEASGSLRITLPHCVTAVQTAVRAELRSVLTQRLVAPLLTASDTGVLPADPRYIHQDSVDRGMAALHAAAAVQCLTRSPSNLRYVSFSHAQPSLRHPSWDALWVAAAAAAGTTPGPPASCSSETPARHAQPLLDHRDVSPLGDVTCEAVAATDASAVVQPHLGELTPLLGCQTAFGSFTAVTASSPTHSVEAALRSHVTYWERHCVDVFVPPCVQVQAAVRHLLRRRRPPADFLTREGGAEERRCATSPRPLALLAVVAPEHHTAAYVAFMEMLERERSASLARVAAMLDSPQRLGVLEGPVQVMLFDSSGLMRVSSAV